MTDKLELVQFMTAEIGDDLIVSFFVVKPHDPTDGRSIILMRDKKWEHLVAELEKGVTVGVRRESACGYKRLSECHRP